jgi:vesicle transport through interaction with t-SNAREs 1
MNRHVDALLLQAGDLLKQMEVEVRSHDSATRKVLSEKVNQYKRVLTSLKTDFKKVKEDSERNNLFAGTKSGEDRQRLLNTNEKLGRQNETILAAQRSVAETEDVAMDITNELARNREKIESSRDKVRMKHEHIASCCIALWRGESSLKVKSRA